MRTTLSVFLLTSIFAAACGGAQPSSTGATPEPEPTAVPTATESAAPVESAAPDAAAVPDVWKDGMTKDQQVAFMKAKVMPKMTPVFNGHDATKYASVTCVTCHGPQYKEPKEFLPKLTFKDGAITSFKDKPEISKWMAEKVVPEMAAAMGQKPFDPATKTGFGCGGCHTIEMK
jgi:mono/diheme cytochrome c family protein